MGLCFEIRFFLLRLFSFARDANDNWANKGCCSIYCINSLRLFIVLCWFNPHVSLSFCIKSYSCWTNLKRSTNCALLLFDRFNCNHSCVPRVIKILSKLKIESLFSSCLSSSWWSPSTCVIAARAVSLSIKSNRGAAKLCKIFRCQAYSVAIFPSTLPCKASSLPSWRRVNTVCPSSNCLASTINSDLNR